MLNRCFIALGLAPEPGPSLAAGLQRLRDFGELSVPPPENLHVTLAFLGELNGADISGAADATRAAARASSGSWTVAWGGAGAFPSRRRPRVVWFSLADPATTTKVQGLLIAELRQRGLPVDERPFRPHLTLARVRSELTREKADDLEASLAALVPPLPASVVALVLYRSKQGRGPAVYEQLERASL